MVKLTSKKFLMVVKRKRSYSAPGFRKFRTYKRKRSMVRRKGGMKLGRWATRQRSGARSKALKRSVNLGNTMPRTLFIKLPYREHISMTTATSGNADIYTFRLNSVFDPNYTGIGGQPRYTDWVLDARRYTRYLVYKVDVEVVFRSTQQTSDMQGAIAIREGTPFGSVGPASLFYQGELPQTWTFMLDGTNTGDGFSRRTWRGSFHMAKLFGITKRQLYAEDDYAADYNASPAAQQYLTVLLADDPNQSTSGLTADVEVYIRYHVKCYENDYSEVTS